MWESLVFRRFREPENVVKSDHPDFDCGGARVGTGGRLLSVTSRFDSCHRSLFGDRLVVGFLALNQATEVRPLLPEFQEKRKCPLANHCGVV